MRQLIRRSRPEDAEGFVDIKNRLPMPSASESTKNGGFLLGTDVSTYQKLIEIGYSLTAIVEDEIVGFAIILPDHVVRKSEIWQKRHLANWNIDINVLEQKKLCYFEQLAFDKGHHRMTLAMVYNLVNYAFDQGHEILLTTIVKEPIQNLAAVPFIKAVNGSLVGNIDEEYPIVGHINSDIYLIKSEDFYSNSKDLSFYKYLRANEAIW